MQWEGSPDCGCGKEHWLILAVGLDLRFVGVKVVTSLQNNYAQQSYGTPWQGRVPMSHMQYQTFAGNQTINFDHILENSWLTMLSNSYTIFNTFWLRLY